MNKVEFLNELKEGLTGEVSIGVIKDSLNYYDNYINDKIQSGEDEEAIISNLGHGMFVAKSIIDANTFGGDSNWENRSNKKDNEKVLSRWKKVIIRVGVIIGLISISVILIAIILALVWYLIIPIIILVAIVIIIILIVKQRRKG